MSELGAMGFEEPILKKQKIRQSLSLEEEQAAGFALEKEKKAISKKVHDLEEKETVNVFLKYVAEGEQDQAEALLKETPDLALKKGTVTDLSKREFKEITGFQYALWGLDWHMWRMLLKYMDKEAAAMQFAELESKGTVHGKHFSLLPLIEALKEYLKHYDDWYRVGAWDKMEAYWCRQVGGNQFLLPVGVVNEYCHPSRSFEPLPSFKEELLVRSQKLHGIQGEWYATDIFGGRLGETFGICRSNTDAAAMHIRVSFENIIYAKHDMDAVQHLWQVRQQQLEELRVELRNVMEIKGLLNGHFPSDISSTVLTYF